MKSSKLSSRPRGRKEGEARRRDSGYAGSGPQLLLETEIEPASMEVEGRDSGDSGVGSPSPSSERAWGRRADWRQEARLLASTRAAARKLAAGHGGEVLLVYRPRAHPNLPTLEPNQSRLFIPQKIWERAQPADDTAAIPPGFFLSKSGLTAADIRQVQLPSIPAGVQAAISNGLSLDLLRLVQERAASGPEVARYIFAFLELAFPEPLLEAAVVKTLACLEENIKYVEECELHEAATFLYAPFELPQDVMEMAAVLEFWEAEGEENHLAAAAATSQRGEKKKALVQSCSLPSDKTDLLERSEESLLSQDSPQHVQSMEYLADPVYSTAVHSEDENYCYTATVLNLDPASLSRLVGSAALSCWPEGDGSVLTPVLLPEPHVVVEAAPSTTTSAALPEEEDSPTPLGKKSERSRTRTVQIPSRFKDYSPVPSTVKKARLDSS